MTIDTDRQLHDDVGHLRAAPITVALEAAKAPHTVNLLNFLANEHFYDGTHCHRSTNVTALTVLQCGDPTGTGSGQIGFTIAEENLKGATYPRGTLAMAKTSAAHSTQSQFFLVDKDSQLPPSYTVAGHITDGRSTCSTRSSPLGNDGSNGTGDGAPKQNVYLRQGHRHQELSRSVSPRPPTRSSRWSRRRASSSAVAADEAGPGTAWRTCACTTACGMPFAAATRATSEFTSRRSAPASCQPPDLPVRLRLAEVGCRCGPPAAACAAPGRAGRAAPRSAPA